MRPRLSQADKPGIVATTAEARDPKTCKYTEEGTLIHEMMQRVYKSDRRMAALGSLEVTLTAKDKAMIEETITAKATEKGLSAKEILAKVDIPATVSVDKML